MYILTITCLLFIIAGISNAVMDVLQFKYDQSIFSNLSQKLQKWFNPKISWKNKYKDNNPNNPPKFIGSTTIFVFVTDAWHFFQMLMLTSVQVACGILISEFINKEKLLVIIISTIILKALYGMFFELFFSKILKKK